MIQQKVTDRKTGRDESDSHKSNTKIEAQTLEAFFIVFVLFVNKFNQSVHEGLPWKLNCPPQDV